MDSKAEGKKFKMYKTYKKKFLQKNQGVKFRSTIE